MSGPYRFTQDSTRSPLDRRPPNVFQAGQPPSFKTNINRMKTKKWVEAKKNAYDGDDWGEYDEYDEYGADQEPPPPPPQDQDYRPRIGEPSRSFTDPMQQGPPQPARRNSFDAGDETRSFSSAYPQTAQGGPYEQAQPHGQQPHGASAQTPNRQASAAESDASDTPQHRRDFSPSALPPPLQTRLSPGPTGSATGSPASQFPHHNVNVGQVESPSTMSPRDRAPSNPGKPLPFIRPADIYRRVEEERQRERASLDSSRPSLDSLASRPKDDTQGFREPGNGNNLQGNTETNTTSQPLESVAEGKNEHLPDTNISSAQAAHQPKLPPVRGFSAFDNDFWSGDSQSLNPAQPQVVAPPDDQGLRSVVDKAFTRSDDQRSVPATPISKESDDGVSRSNTTSTAGISPIMSRVPSTATSALKNRNQAGGDRATPVIAEETSEGTTPVSRPTSTAMLGGPHQVPRKPSPSHSRNVSNTSLPRADVTPTRGQSPARAPSIEPEQPTREPEFAYLTSSQSPHEAMEGGLGGPSAAYADREADIATAMSSSPEQAVSGLGAASRESRDAFLESHHNAQSPIQDALPRSRSESPSKGRVQELAGKFGDVSQSRRGSTQSNASRTSVQSWERSQENSRPSSPTKLAPAGDRPTAGREASFRPQLPGQWESYATTAAESTDQTPGDESTTSKAVAGENNAVTSPLGEVDLTPTTDKHPVSATEPSKTSEADPLAALKAAGTAIGDALTASVGSSNVRPDENKEGQEQARSVGNVYLARPVYDRAASSTYSSIPPTPPEKDGYDPEDVPPPPPLKDKSPEPTSPISQQHTPTRPAMLPQLSTDPSDQDQESDRLRKEIVASLSPLKQAETAGSEPSQLSLQPGAPDTTNRDSSILPSEYDSYWADDQTSPRPSQDARRSVQDQSPVAAKSAAPQSFDNNPPSLLTRFSWEDRASHLVSPDGQAQPGALPQTAAHESSQVEAMSPIQESKDEKASNRASSQSFKGAPIPCDGSGNTSGTAQPESGNDAEFNVRAPTPPAEAAKGAFSPPLGDVDSERGASPVSGLHVVNSAVNPEAVDLPARLSADVSPISQPSQPPGGQEEASAGQPKSGLNEVPPSPIVPTSPHSATDTGKSPTSDKPLGFRDIVNIKSSSERIVTYNKTRDYWANADHGLNDWISSAMTNNPELASQPTPQPRPFVANSGSFRHKPTGSLSLFGKHHSSSNSQAQSTPYFEQYNSAASSVPGPNASSSTADSRPQGSSSAGPGQRITSHQMQAKGKDLLHSAGVLGGKGMTGAKGLFAKGKSRFRASGGGSDKDARSESAPSSREASEEPELMTTTPRMSMDTNESPKDAKKKRRFSSPFHRSSRSRSRPSSIVLPQNAHLDFGFGSTPRHTPPRETPPAECSSRGGSRPQSFHAPDSWNIGYDISQPHTIAPTSTPPRSVPEGLQPPERLGILPSPAKSAFSLVNHDKEGDSDIPPVPPIPDGLEEQESASHKMLQSVIRYSTPPVMERGHSTTSPFFGEDTVAGAKQRPVSSIFEPHQGTDGNAEEKKQTTQDTDILRKNATQTSNPVHDEDEDDLPPRLNHDPIQPLKPYAAVTEMAQERVETVEQKPDVATEDKATGDGPSHISQSNVSTNPSGYMTVSGPNMEEPPTLQAEAEASVDSAALVNHNDVGAVSDDEYDDDDKPPILNHEPHVPGSVPESSFSPGVAPNGVSHDEHDKRPRLQVETWTVQGDGGDVSPMISAIKPATGTTGVTPAGLSHSDSHPLTHTGTHTHTHMPPAGMQIGSAQRDGPRTVHDYETLKIGEDISPISTTPGLDDELEARDQAQAQAQAQAQTQSPSQSHQSQAQSQSPPPPSSSRSLSQAQSQSQAAPPAAIAIATGQVENAASSTTASAPAAPAAPVLVSASEAMETPKTATQTGEFAKYVESAFGETTGESALSGEDLTPRAPQSSLPLAGPSSLTPAQPPPQHQHQHQHQQPAHERQKLAASPYQVVRAVEYFSHSQSSFSSWEQDSVAAPSQSEGSQRGDRPDESDAPPVPGNHTSTQPPPPSSLVSDQVQNKDIRQPSSQPQPQSQLQSHYSQDSKSVNAMTPSIAVEQHPLPPHGATQHQEPKQPPTVDRSLPSNHKRSQSLLSAISSAVSADTTTPVSSTSSGPRSRPTSAGLQKHPSPQRTPAAAVAPTVQEEQDSNETNNSHVSASDEYDLYADHDGIVKDVKDEKGQPLKVTTIPISTFSSPPGTAVTPSNNTQAPSSQEDEASRYSFERPMSFVSSSRDANGKPQDQINRPAGEASQQNVPPVPQIPGELRGQQPPPEHPTKAPNAAEQQLQVQNQANGLAPSKSISDSQSGFHTVSPPNGSLRSHKGQTYSNVSSQPPSTQGSPPLQASGTPGHSRKPSLQDPRSPPDAIQGFRMQDPIRQDPRGQHMAQGPPFPQGRQPPPVQPMRQDPRLQHQPLGPPRNEYERQQQAMAMVPRFANQAGPHPMKPEEKSSSRPKLSAVFKGLSSKALSGNTKTTTPPPNGSANLPPPVDPNRGASYQSGLGDLPEQVLPKNQKRTSVLPTVNRPKSFGTESHVSHESTKVQAADSRIDLRYPASPAPFQGIPPPKPPPGAPPRPQPQQRASTSNVPDSAGKKKRFSSLGGLFNRSSTTANVTLAKIKPSKEDKKAQKAQKHANAPLPQPGGVQQWGPPDYQRQMALQQQGMQQPQRPFPGNPQMVSQDFQQQAQLQRQQMHPNGYQQQAVQPTSPQSAGSAYHGTRQLALDHQSRPPGMQPPPASSSGSASQSVHDDGSRPPYEPPREGYYIPDRKVPLPDPRTSPPPSTSQTQQQQIDPQIRQQQQEQLRQDQSRQEQLRQEQIRQEQIRQDQIRQEQLRQEQIRQERIRQDQLRQEQLRQEQIRQQQFQQQQQLRQQQQPPPPLMTSPQNQNMRSVSSPIANPGPGNAAIASQRRVSSPPGQTYETPPIPAAYNHVHGAYVSPASQQAAHSWDHQEPPPQAPQYSRQNSETSMHPLSPQISGQSQFVPGQRHNSDSSSVSMVSPVVGPSQGLQNIAPNQRPQNRMSSISEATTPDRPWNLDLPAGATEQEIVRARQRQYMEQQIAHNQQVNAERTGKSPSPHPHSNTHSPASHVAAVPPPQPQQNANRNSGFREVLPRRESQPMPPAEQSPPVQDYQVPQNQGYGHEQQHHPQSRQTHSPRPLQPAPVHPNQPVQPSAYPLPMSPDTARSPINPLAGALPPPPPPQLSHSPVPSGHHVSQSPSPHSQQRNPPQQYDDSQQRGPPQQYDNSQYSQRPDYDQTPDEPPPSYTGPGVPNEGMDKERHRPPNIVTDPESRGREHRQRQASIGILQHPTPATMAASPQRSSADMGANSLRQTMLEQEERDRQERLQRAEIQRQETAREREERERARARARELERSVSGGGRVSSLRSVRGSRGGSSPGGWVARSGTTARPVFELPAEEDEEPVMRATSFPGQEWVPTWHED